MIACPEVPEQYEQVGLIEIPEDLWGFGECMPPLAEEISEWFVGMEKSLCGVLELED